jgi:hypothetical protein
MEQLLLLGGRFLGGLKACVSPGGELVLKLLDSPCGINELQLAGVKWVADITNVDLEFFSGAASGEAIAATAGHFGFEVLGVDAIFHDSDLVYRALREWIGRIEICRTLRTEIYRRNPGRINVKSTIVSWW